MISPTFGHKLFEKEKRTLRLSVTGSVTKGNELADFRSQALTEGHDVADFRSQALLKEGNNLSDFRSQARSLRESGPPSVLFCQQRFACDFCVPRRP